MSSDKKLAKTIVENSIAARRDLQFQELKKWDKGLITGTQAIENILELDKLIFWNARDNLKDNITEKKDG